MKYFYIVILCLSIVLSGCGSTSTLIDYNDVVKFDYDRTVTKHYHNILNKDFKHVFYIKNSQVIKSDLYINDEFYCYYNYHHVNNGTGIDKLDRLSKYLEFKQYEYIKLLRLINTIDNIIPVIIQDQYGIK